MFYLLKTFNLQNLIWLNMKSYWRQHVWGSGKIYIHLKWRFLSCFTWCQTFCTRWRLGLFPAVSKLCLCHVVVNTRSCSVKCNAQTILPHNCFPLRLLKSAVCVTRLNTWHRIFNVCGSSGRSWELENVPSDLKMLSFYSLVSLFFLCIFFICQKSLDSK